MNDRNVHVVGRAFVVMGVSGCGKSTVGLALAQRLGATFLEGDSFHPPANIAKMSAGSPLSDADRWPWLDAVGAAIRAVPPGGFVCSCSALRFAYRQRLRMWVGDIIFLHLGGSRDVLRLRLDRREGHFMPPGLLDSQLATLELPEGETGIYHLDTDQSLTALVENAWDVCTGCAGSVSPGGPGGD